MTSTITRQTHASTAALVPFGSADTALRFERRAITAIRHATRYGLFTAFEASTMVDRVYALTAETMARLTARAPDRETSRG